MNNTQTETIVNGLEADILAGKRYEPLRSGNRPIEIAQAYAVQAELVARAQRRGAGPKIGVKVGLTSKSMQKFCGVSEPVVGSILQGRVHPNPCVLARNQFQRLGIESELALHIWKPVPVVVEGADYSPVLECVDQIAAAFEIVDDRNADYQQLDGPSIVADNSWNMGMVLGANVSPSGYGMLSDLAGSLYIDDRLIGTASSADVMGGPISVLAWLARFSDAMAYDLLPGQWIMTGSIITTQFAVAGQRFRFELGKLPPVELSVT